MSYFHFYDYHFKSQTKLNFEWELINNTNKLRDLSRPFINIAGNNCLCCEQKPRKNKITSIYCIKNKQSCLNVP